MGEWDLVSIIKSIAGEEWRTYADLPIFKEEYQKWRESKGLDHSVKVYVGKEESDVYRKSEETLVYYRKR